jgi:hypothetical protein
MSPLNVGQYAGGQDPASRPFGPEECNLGTAPRRKPDLACIALSRGCYASRSPASSPYPPPPGRVVRASGGGHWLSSEIPTRAASAMSKLTKAEQLTRKYFA